MQPNAVLSTTIAGQLDVPTCDHAVGSTDSRHDGGMSRRVPAYRSAAWRRPVTTTRCRLTPAGRSEWGCLRLRDGVPDAGTSQLSGRERCARHTHHRSAGEIVHGPPPTPQSSNRSRQERHVPEHRRPPRCRPTATIAEATTAHASPSRSASRGLGQQDVADAEGPSGATTGDNSW